MRTAKNETTVATRVPPGPRGNVVLGSVAHVSLWLRTRDERARQR